MNRRRMMMLQQTSKLPTNYTELKYLVCTGAQWFDTGIYANEYTGARYKYTISRSKQYGNYILSGTDFPAFPFFRGNSGGQLYVNRDKNITFNYAYKTNTPYEIFTDKNGDVYVNDEFIVSIGNIARNDAKKSTVKLGIYYGELNQTGAYCLVGNLYYCQIFQNGEIVRDFIPCVNSDGIAGMYDLVEHKFYKSATSTNYTAGEVV